MLRRALPGLLLSSLTAVASCKSVGVAHVKADEGETETSPEASEIPNAPGQNFAPGPKFCAAVRGNATLIMAHFASYARLIEHYGLIDALAGGSSASISGFLYESIYANPLVHKCHGADCSPEASAARASLMLKSIQGYVGVLASTEEALAFGQIEPIIAKIKSKNLTLSKFEAFQDINTARKAVTEVLSSQDLRDVLNTEALTSLANPLHPIFHVKDMGKAMMAFGKLSAEEPTIFVRPGILDFKALARKIGRLADFYAGYGPYDAPAVEAWLDACAEPGRGKDWSEMKDLPAGTSTCGATYVDLAGSFRKRLLPVEATTPSRIDDPIGKYMQVLAVDAVLVGPQPMAAFKNAQKQYTSAETIEFKPSFDALRVGYWGREADLARLQKNERGYDDIKTKKFLALGAHPWSEILALSPAEPGLGRLQQMSANWLSAGGWPDLHPTLALRNIGCENIVYITRRGDESDFIQGMTKLLGMSESQQHAYFNLDDSLSAPPSAIRRSLQEADGIWCTNWSAFKANPPAPLSNHSFNAPLAARSDFFRKGANPYPNASDTTPFRACSPDAPASAM